MWTDLGQEGGEGVWAPHMDVVNGRSSNHDSQAELNQAASEGRLFFLQLEDMGGKSLAN